MAFYHFLSSMQKNKVIRCNFLKDRASPFDPIHSKKLCIHRKKFGWTKTVKKDRIFASDCVKKKMEEFFCTNRKHFS